ncbi:MAG TPA: serine hydrolase [Rhizomicrobium sp.]|jgi:CubicO group peptidase (beta-lactamase class C family)
MRALQSVRFAIAVVLGTVMFATPVVAGPAESRARLAPLEARIRAGEFGNIHSLLVRQNGEMLAEWYFAGPDEKRGEPLGNVTFTADTPHDLRSVSKSIVSLLFGIALQDGAIKNLDTPVLDYFPEYADLRTPERMKITLRDMLSMTSGLHWDEDTYLYTDVRNSETAMDAAADRYRFILSQPIDAPPGTRWRYSGGDVAVIAAVLARTTKMPLEEYARIRLFEPLGIAQFAWLKDARGIPFAASGVRLRPRDMMTVGELVFDGGAYDGKQIVPRDWIVASTTRHADVDPGQCGTQYGYFWWIVPACGAAPAWFSGIGNGGQYIMIVHDLNAVIVSTAGAYNDHAKQGLTRKMLAAVREALGGAAPPEH